MRQFSASNDLFYQPTAKRFKLSTMHSIPGQVKPELLKDDLSVSSCESDNLAKQQLEYHNREAQIITMNRAKAQQRKRNQRL